GLVQRGGLGELDTGIQLLDLGVYRLRDVPAPERLFQVDYAGMPRPEFPPLKAASGYASRLPLQFTRFFGREAEIAHLLELLGAAQANEKAKGEGRKAESDKDGTEPAVTLPDFAFRPSPFAFRPNPRLVTVTGMGGTGKTRLALEVGERLNEAYRGAVFF